MAVQNIAISQILRLLDLNGPETNFSIMATIEASEGFQYVLLNQKELDEEEEFKFKNSVNKNGVETITVSVSSNPGEEYQGYYLGVKSNNDINAKFWIDKVELKSENKADNRSEIKNYSPLIWGVSLIVFLAFFMNKLKN